MIYKICTYAPADHPAITQETSEPGACYRDHCQITPSDRSESCPSTVQVHASSNRGVVSLPSQSRTHSPESVSCTFLSHMWAWNQQESDGLAALLHKYSNFTFCSWHIFHGYIILYLHMIQYIYMLYILHMLHDIINRYRKLDSDCGYAAGKWFIPIGQMDEWNTVHIYKLRFLKYKCWIGTTKCSFHWSCSDSCLSLFSFIVKVKRFSQFWVCTKTVRC